MPDVIGVAVIEIRADTDALDRDIVNKVRNSANKAGAALEKSLGARMKQAGERLSAYGESVNRVGNSLSRLTIPLAAAGAAAIKMGYDFGLSMTRIQTLVGISRKELDGMRDDVLKLSSETARSPQELAEALYFVTSAGFSGAQAMEILDASARAAALGMGQTAVIADAVTSAVAAYADVGLKAADATDIMGVAIKVGKLEAAELAPAMSRVIPIAASMGVSFADVSAAMAAMSLAGIDAAEGATALRGFLSTILKPSKQARDALSEFGLSVDDLRKNLAEKGLLSTLQLMNTAFGDNQDALGEIIPNVRALTGFLNLTGQDAAKVEEIFRALGDATGYTAEAFGELAQTPEFKFQLAMNDFKVALTEIGLELLPKLSETLRSLDEEDLKQISGAIADFADTTISVLREMLDLWGKMPEGMQEFILKALVIGAVAGPPVKLLGGMASTLGAILKIASPAAGGLGTVGGALGTVGTQAGAASAGIAGVSASVAILAGAFAAFAGAVIGAKIYKTVDDHVIKPIEEARQNVEQNVGAMQSRLIEGLSNVGASAAQIAPINIALNEMRRTGDLSTEAMARVYDQTKLLGTAAVYGLDVAQATLDIAEGGRVAERAIEALRFRLSLTSAAVGTLNAQSLAQVNNQADVLAAKIGVPRERAEALRIKINEVNASGFPILGGSTHEIARLLGITEGQARELKGALNAIEGTYNVRINIDEYLRKHTIGSAGTGDAVGGGQVSGLEHLGGQILHAGGSVLPSIRPDERLIIGQTREFMQSRPAVDYFGLEFMRAANRRDLSGVISAVWDRFGGNFQGGGQSSGVTREDLMAVVQMITERARPIQVTEAVDGAATAEAINMRLAGRR